MLDVDVLCNDLLPLFDLTLALRKGARHHTIIRADGAVGRVVRSYRCLSRGLDFYRFTLPS